ncbi:MAG TPA: hypothetical protein VFT05_12800, partial [Burkholderiaceae bacterium]|nr:hypothetical protein [Burkholderiaceae bacterium]
MTPGHTPSLPASIGGYPVTALLSARPGRATFAGYDPAGGRPLLLKLGSPCDALAAGLRHPHLVMLLAAGTDNGQPYSVLEWVAGRSLRAVLAEGTPPPEQALAWMAQLLAALDY